MTTYDVIGREYSERRHADPRLAAAISAALGDASSILNVGAGTGSYEPTGRTVVALEPSTVMITQRPRESAPVVRGVAEYLPFRDRQFDAVLGILTLHHWADRARGLRECRRVAADRVVLLTWDPVYDDLWLVRDYFPQFLVADRPRFPSMAEFGEIFGHVEVQKILIPADCTDGFLGAYWKRPRAYLDPTVRAGISSFHGVTPDDPRLVRLRRDIESGEWAARHRNLLEQDTIDLGYRLVVALTP